MTVSNAYFTNLFISQNFTNFYLYSTNIYNADNTVSNYFTTNVFNDTYVSNFFVTNQIFYQTNQYLTYVSTTNFLSYITNQYISNFWNTNIYVNNSYVSNYFTTNYNPLITVISNYTYNVAWPLTNATLYGTTTFAPISGTTPGVIYFQSAVWSGPTNTLPCTAQEYTYTATSDISMTGLSSIPASPYTFSTIIIVTNSASTNITWRFPATWSIPERTSSVTVSNATRGAFSFHYSPIVGSNGVYRQF